MSVTIDIHGLDELRQTIERSHRELVADTVVAVSVATRAGADTAKRTHRWKNRTGETEDKIDVERVRRSVDGAEGAVVSAAAISTILNEGSRAHEIRAKKKGVLSWVSGGSRVFAKVVQHPGTSADGYMARAGFTAETTLQIELAQAAQRFADKIER